ncbi:MAG TPA: DUF885 domain-containing protein [Flavobacteriales bacterium]|nr:DUF885 domain-containing protein [Flavobacteriales bacterium]
MQNRLFGYLLFPLLVLFLSARKPANDFKSFVIEFVSLYNQAGFPEIDYDYHGYFETIPKMETLNEHEAFFQKTKENLGKYNRSKLNTEDQTIYDHIEYETDFSLERIALEKEWVSDGRNIPENGLHSLKNHKAWYKFFIKRYTSTGRTPEEIFDMGKAEVFKVKREIKKIQDASGYKDSLAFYTYLKSDKFQHTDKNKIIKEFEKIDSTVRANMNGFFGKLQLPKVYPMEWPNANAFTPPGMYLNHSGNAFGKDVFQFNFYGQKYNARAMEWLYMHEAIPGHHLQSVFRQVKPGTVQSIFLYPGNFEGWACHMEYFGKDFGLYNDAYSYLGKWEWDLVRSARLVIDAGIHYYGWTKAEALKYWKETIPGQDEIAEREVTRVTNWCAQALSYKVGSGFIDDMKIEWMNRNPKKKQRDFYLAYLKSGNIPLLVMYKRLIGEQESK